jgi:chromosome segregation ATPase
MRTRVPFESLLMATLCSALCMPLSASHAAKLYKWVDENGQVRYGDHIPPQYAKRGAETLSKQGVVVETRPAAKTPEQLAEEQRQAALAEQQARLERERAYQDKILLDTFTNEDEMVMTRDGKIEAIEANIRVTNGRIEKLRQRVADLNLRAANLERSGKPVPSELAQQIKETRVQIQQNLGYIESRKQEQQSIRDKFEIDIKRFRELKAARAEAATGAPSP